MGFQFHLSLTRFTLWCLYESVAFIKKKPHVSVCVRIFIQNPRTFSVKYNVLKLIRKSGYVLLRNPLKMNTKETLTSSFKSVKYISAPYHTFKAIKYSESREYFISQI